MLRDVDEDSREPLESRVRSAVFLTPLMALSKIPR